MSKGKELTLKLTPRQAHILWTIVDGATDAGACAEGLTDEENFILSPIRTKLLTFSYLEEGRMKQTPGFDADGKSLGDKP